MTDTHKKHPEDQWEDRDLGASEAYVRKVSARREKVLDEKLNLQTISIRLQKNLIEALKELSAENGLGYQPYIRQLLTQHVRSEKRKRDKNLQVITK